MELSVSLQRRLETDGLGRIPLFCMKLKRSSRNSFLFGSRSNSYSCGGEEEEEEWRDEGAARIREKNVYNQRKEHGAVGPAADTVTRADIKVH